MKNVCLFLAFCALMGCFALFAWHEAQIMFKQDKKDQVFIKKFNKDSATKFEKSPHDIKKPYEGLSAQAKCDVSPDSLTCNIKRLIATQQN